MQNENKLKRKKTMYNEHIWKTQTNVTDETSFTSSTLGILGQFKLKKC